MPKRILLSQEDILQRFFSVHGDHYDYSMAKYTGMFNYVIIKCNICNNIFSQSPNNHIHNKRGCGDCGKKVAAQNNTYTTQEFITKSIAVHQEEELDYSKTIYKGIKIPIIITCKKHGDFPQTPDKHLQGNSCPKCAIENRTNKSKLSLPYILEQGLKIHGDIYDYSLLEKFNYKNNKEKLPIICKKCTNVFFKTTVDFIIAKRGCLICYQKKSIGEEIINTFLLKRKIKFIKEKTFSDCKNKLPLRFDFFLPDYNTCIEYDGIQHFEEINYFTLTNGDTLLDRTNRDEIKNKYCKTNDINLIRIKYTDNIEVALNNKLSL